MSDIQRILLPGPADSSMSPMPQGTVNHCQRGGSNTGLGALFLSVMDMDFPQRTGTSERVERAKETLGLGSKYAETFQKWDVKVSSPVFLVRSGKRWGLVLTELSCSRALFSFMKLARERTQSR